MPKEILTRCGYRCDLCPAYKENIGTKQQKQYVSDGWYKIYGFRIPAEKICCDGCVTAGSTAVNLIDKDCPVRPCVFGKGLENCSQCEDFICGKLKERIVIADDLLKKHGLKLTRIERSFFIKPYENKKRLDILRRVNYPHSRMLNEQMAPDETDITNFINERAMVRAWNNLRVFLKEGYGSDGLVTYGGRKYGWALKYKHGQKTLVTLFPERDSFSVLLVFGKKELEKIDVQKADFSGQILHLIERTKQYHDGKWVWIRLKDQQFYTDICNLINLKS
ncbi:DUF3788 family protein [candidate division KSB1 bacterium]|nr:DUF3788 family protein [candidate division KSB1 bacterium]